MRVRLLVSAFVIADHRQILVCALRVWRQRQRSLGVRACARELAGASEQAAQRDLRFNQVRIEVKRTLIARRRVERTIERFIEAPKPRVQDGANGV